MLANEIASEHMRGLRDPKSAAPYEASLDAKRKALNVSDISMNEISKFLESANHAEFHNEIVNLFNDLIDAEQKGFGH
jgi:hypothetical protein